MLVGAVKNSKARFMSRSVCVCGVMKYHSIYLFTRTVLDFVISLSKSIKYPARVWCRCFLPVYFQHLTTNNFFGGGDTISFESIWNLEGSLLASLQPTCAAKPHRQSNKRINNSHRLIIK